jgi:hypothetical protein
MMNRRCSELCLYTILLQFKFKKTFSVKTEASRALINSFLNKRLVIGHWGIGHWVIGHWGIGHWDIGHWVIGILGIGALVTGILGYWSLKL